MANRLLSIWDRQWLAELNFSALLSKITRYRSTVILAVIAILAYQSTGVFYKAMGLMLLRVKAVPAPAAMSPSAVNPEPVDAFKIIAERNLFGTTDRTLTDKQTGSQEVRPDIAASLEVRGTVAGDAKYGFAVIEDKVQKKQKLFRIGDTISGAKLIRIVRNAVVLMVNNREMMLRVPETVERGALSSPTATAAAQPAVSPGGDIMITRSEIEANLRDMGTMLSQAQIRPYFTAGRPDGFMISSIRGGSLYQRIGLADGDIVQAVNNRKLTSGEDVVELYNLLRTASTLTLKILRQGREQSLNYTFR